jgi:thiamine-monophosphate kinase
VAEPTLGEFDLIERFFRRPPVRAVLGGGDDCALIQIPAAQNLAITTDMLVEGRHFFAGADPYRLGWKCLAVNLSDLAAMGATPRYFTLSFALPKADAAWLEPFSKGLFALADQRAIEIIGGDTTAGPLTISITAMGEVPPNKALKRSGALVGDEIWISHEVGGAALQLFARWGKTTIPAAQNEALMLRMEMPTPRIELGEFLRGYAHAAVDISDGLTGDLSHILRASKVAGIVHLSAISTPQVLREKLIGHERALAIQLTLSGGDDYELCFTAPVSSHAAIAGKLSALGLRGGVIGQITAGSGLTILDESGVVLAVPKSFDHFQS